MNIEALAELDSAAESIATARKILTSSPPPAPSPVPSPSAPSTIKLPHESNLSVFYGSPSSSGNNLDWFNFPISEMRLYSREGAHLSDHTGDRFDDHRCNKMISDRLETAFGALYNELGREQFFAEGWHVYSGCFNYRTKTGGSSLSTHAWGIAVDINSTENPYRQTTTTFSEKAIDLMERFGFLSGGRAWGKDWMHFQAAIPYVSSGSYYARNGLPKHIVAA